MLLGGFPAVAGWYLGRSGSACKFKVVVRVFYVVARRLFEVPPI